MTARFPALLLIALWLAAPSAEARKRFGFQGLPATYRGGYSVNAGETTWAGPATVRIRAARNGRSAKVAWTNTFYNERGAYRATLLWLFRPDGTFLANTLDPLTPAITGPGTFRLEGKRPVFFSATDATGAVRAKGMLRLSGGGSITIAVALTGLPEGAVSYGFTGSRRR